MDERPRTSSDSDAPTPSPGDAGGVLETLQRFGHDMRAAVSDVVGGLRLVDFDRLDPETRTQMERVAAAGETLASLLESALLHASGTTPQVDADLGAPLRLLLDHWRKRWTGHATESGVRFELVADVDQDLALLASRITVDRIVSNILGNALDHSGAADVRLSVRMDKLGQLIIEVADSGKGFDLGSLPTRKRRGGGMGLSIARELSRWAGGEFRIANGPPLGGAVVRLLLPAELVSQSIPSDPHGEALPDLSALSILVAEDNPTNRTILRGMLKSLGARPVFAKDGAEALEMIDQTRFDVALIDIEMPRVSGLEVLRTVRARTDRTALMPLVALTAYVLRDNREAIYAAGADAIIGKPVSSVAEFGRAILRYAGGSISVTEPEDTSPRDADDSAFGVKMDETRLDDLLSVAGPNGAAELLARLTEDLGAVRHKLEVGVSARSVAVIREQTHIIVAIAGSVGADRLCRRSEALNIAANRDRLDDLEALYQPCRRDLDDLIAHLAVRMTPQR